MKKKTVKAWTIYYRVRTNRHDKWCNWVGPLGIYAFRNLLPSEKLTWFSDRPFLFRTRKQARDIAKEKTRASNQSWEWVQYTVHPIKVTYENL